MRGRRDVAMAQGRKESRALRARFPFTCPAVLSARWKPDQLAGAPGPCTVMTMRRF